MKFGVYRLIRRLGRGAMGVVFEARSKHIEQRVALKLMVEGEFATDAEIRRFLFGAEAASRLQHPNIVPVLHVDRHRGHAFFTMPIMRGGSLARVLAKRASRAAPGRSWPADARLMVGVARGVQHAHEHGLLHRDLKPANILLDERGNALLADFGLAKELNGERQDNSQVGAGTEAYMSPEQAAAGPQALTVRADIYSLGAVLYELLTGKVPFYDSAPSELRHRVASDEAVTAPRALAPGLPRELEAICLKCLEKDPARRYASAAALAEDLECIVAGDPISIPPLTPVARALHWVRRNPRLFARMVWSVAALLTITLGGAWLWQASVRERRAALETNAFIASGQAGAALFQLREYADRVQQAALDTSLTSLHERFSGEPQDSSKGVMLNPPDSLKTLSRDFDSAFVLTTEGKVIAQWPLPPISIWHRGYGFRDYFRGAKALGQRGSQAPYVARAFRSERDGELKFGVSTPLFEHGRWVGVLAAIVAADSAFGQVRMQDSAESGRIAALLGPRDLEREDPESLRAVKRFVFLIHDKLRHGQEVAAPKLAAVSAAFHEASPAGQQFSLRYASPRLVTDYRDPLLGFEGHWHAAFAPVGGTGYVVVVQTKQDSFFHRLGALLARAYSPR
jgi:serine/threonine-protein kinase